MGIQTLAAALVGAVIGVGSTLITDLVRARRDLDQKWADTKRLVYVRFLMAITQTHSRIKVAALGELNAAEKLAAENGAFYNDPMHAEAKAVLRELAITAPENINRLANETYDYLRQMRNVLSRPSITTADPEYRTASKPFLSSLGALQDAMRDDLRPGPRHHRKHVLSREVNRPREVVVPDLQIADEP